jgi:hypothetical protein
MLQAGGVEMIRLILCWYRGELCVMGGYQVVRMLIERSAK